MLVSIVCVSSYLTNIVLVQVTRESLTSSIGDWRHFSREFESHAGCLCLLLRRLREVNGKLLVVSICSRVIHPSTWNNSAPTGRIFVEFCIGRLLLIFIDEVQVWLKSEKNVVVDKARLVPLTA